MTDSTGPTTIAPRPWRRHGVFVSDCEQTLANMFIVRDAKNRFVGAFDRVADAVVCTDAVNLADKPESRPPHLDPRELGTVLAALRNWQRTFAATVGDNLLDIASDGGSTLPLSISEIETLCERLNTSPDPLAIPSAADLRKSRLADAGEEMYGALLMAQNDFGLEYKGPTMDAINAAILKANGGEVATPNYEAIARAVGFSVDTCADDESRFYAWRFKAGGYKETTYDEATPEAAWKSACESFGLLAV